MRKKTITQSILLMVMMLAVGFFTLSGCTVRNNDPTYYTVTFETNGGNVITPLQIENGRRIAEIIEEPTKVDQSLFKGWYKDNTTFLRPWDFAIDIVTSNVTLYAKWMISQPYPTEVAMTSIDFSNQVTWDQTGVDETTDFTVTAYLGTPATRTEVIQDEDGANVTITVEYYEYGTVGTEIAGAHQVDGETKILWTPSNEVQGGVYKLVIETNGEDPVEVIDLAFKGVGTQTNPYLLCESTDLIAIANSDQVGAQKYYKVFKNFSHEVVFNEIEGNEFLGVIDGNGMTITVSGNAGMFYELGSSAIIDNLTVAGTITTASTRTVGALSIINRGTIRNSTSRAAITSSAGMVGDPTSKEIGGAGGFVGINETGGVIDQCTFVGASSSEGVIKALIGGGGIASINRGTISNCSNRGTLGAYNSVESGKSLSNYSYMGGIAGFNYGMVTQCSTTSTGKLLAQRYYNNGSPTDSANNRVVGGIVGYNANTGTIRASYFNGIRVHGDQYVGGISGINAGTIDSCYTGGRYYTSTTARSYVGGRLNVGGIVGALEGSGTVSNCYNAANVYSFDDTAYAIASSSTNCVSIMVNHDPRSLGTQTYGNTSTDTPLAPTGSGNSTVSNSSLSLGDGIHYQLSSSYASGLGSEFAVDDNETLLAWQIES